MVMPMPARRLFICRRAPSRALSGGHLVERPAGPRRYIERIGEAERQPLAAGPSDHRAIVRAQFGRRYDQRCADLEGETVEYLSQRLVCGYTACGNERARRPKARTEKHQTGPQPIEHNIDNRLLKAGTEISDILVAERRDFFRFQAQRGLESGEREISVLAPVHRARKSEACCVAAESLPLDLRSARIAKTQKLCGLVKGLANRIILRCAKPDIVADAAHSHDLGVPPGGQKKAIRKCRLVGQARG